MKHLISFNESKMDKYKSLEQRIKEIKDNMLDEILTDSELTKLEKLELISRNKLFKTAGSIQHPFSKYNDEFIEIIRRNPACDARFGGRPMIDDMFCANDMYDRHQVIDLAQVAMDATEDYFYDEADDNEEENKEEKKITILSNRSTRDKFKITPEEFVDCLYDWCIENKTIAFKKAW